VLGTKSPKYLEMAQGHISLLVLDSRARRWAMPRGAADFVMFGVWQLKKMDIHRWIRDG
jgi:hypothetical protein